jgi:hypothetical protein
VALSGLLDLAELAREFLPLLDYWFSFSLCSSLMYFLKNGFDPRGTSSLYIFLLEGAFGILCFFAYRAATFTSFLLALAASAPLEPNISSSPKPPPPPKPSKKSD